MEADSGKLFVGGISWETEEDRLREYFSRFGEVTEAVIMRDRNTGRARGFGFVVFTDATLTAIAEARPESLEQLAKLPGVGPSKLEKYGEAVLAVLVESTTL